ncbi:MULTISPECIES: hypothetical protein [Lactobacillus]|uniref:hypothetical protein n=1 Tax=Lactobacillus TaxID=1578 RepID=UPI00137470EA|nr:MULTISPECIES: hypothetical protein [Lactobacillus]
MNFWLGVLLILFWSMVTDSFEKHPSWVSAIQSVASGLAIVAVVVYRLIFKA